MLVLTRKHQEKIRIGDHIIITVLKTKGKTVRLGIEAPMEVPVIRGELSFEGQAVESKPRVEVTASRRRRRGRRSPSVRTPIASATTGRRRRKPVDASRAAGKHRRVSACSASRASKLSQVLPKMVGWIELRFASMLDRRSVSA